MKSRSSLFLVLLVGLILLAALGLIPDGDALAATLDQSFIPSDLTFGLGIGSSPYVRGQTFTAGLDGQLDSVDLLLNRSSEMPIGDIDLSIRSGTDYSNPALISTSFSSGLVPIGDSSDGTGSAFVPVDLSAFGLSVSSGDVLSLWILSDNGQEVASWWGASLSSALYPGGSALTDANGAVIVYRADLGFKTYVNTDVSAVPLPTALPLFASGLGMTAWLGRRKKRQAATV